MNYNLNVVLNKFIIPNPNFAGILKYQLFALFCKYYLHLFYFIDDIICVTLF